MKEKPMSTVQALHDEIEGFDADAAERFKAEMVAAMMDAPLKNFTSLRSVASLWADKRDHLKKMATDPAYRAMVVGDIKERYGVDIPEEKSDPGDAVSPSEEGSADSTDDAATAQENEPSFV
jgi:hypothetical protein